MKRKIAFATASLGNGGTEKHLRDLVIRLDPARTDCVILSYGQDSYTSRLKDQPHVKVAICGNLVCWEAGFYVRRGAVFYGMDFVRFRPDTIVFVNGCLGLFRWRAYLAARLIGARQVVAIEHSTPSLAPPRISSSGSWNYIRRRIGWRARLIWKHRLTGLLCDKVVCVSNSIRERLINEYRYPESKCVVISNGVDLEYFSPSHRQGIVDAEAELRAAPAAGTILCVASLVKLKRIDLLLDALATVVKNHPSCRCIIVGGGPLEMALRAQSTRLGLEASVYFAGHVQDVRPYLERADIFVLPSDNEGLPLSVGEAMACGVPCIVTDVGGNRELVLDKQSGLIVERGSTEQLAEAISYLLGNPEERRRMGIKARQCVRENFNLEDTMGQLKTLLLRQA